MVKRRLPKKQPSSAPAAKKKAGKEDDSGGICLGCSCRDAYVHLQLNSQAHVLFAEPTSKPAVACVTCAFHASLVSQLRSALQDDLRRPLASCLVCRSSGRLLGIHQVEGASDALFHPSIQAVHVTSQISPNRKLCTSCAYSLHWLFKQTQVNENKMSIKTEPVETVEIAARAGRPKVQEKIKPGKKTKDVKPTPTLLLKRQRKPSAAVAQVQSSSSTRILRVRTIAVIELSDDEEQEEEEEEEERQELEPALKRRRAEPVKAVKKVEKPKRAPSSRPTRTKAPPAKPEPVKEKRKFKGAKNVVQNADKPRPARFNRAATPELVPYECQVCSKTFESTVSGRLHELEHTGRKLDIKLSRCRTPPGSLSPIPGSLSSLSGDDDDKRRKPRKSLSPKKNSAKDRVHGADDKHQDFLFHAPAVLQFPKDLAKSTSETIDFSFDKPLEVKSNEEEIKNDFSDDEEEASENVANCITSLETSEKADEDFPETETTTEKSPEKTSDKPEDQQNDSPIISSEDNKQVNGTLESPEQQKEETPDDNDTTEERPAKQMASKTAFSFDFFDEPPKKTTLPNKSLNSVSMDDLEEPYPDQTEKEKTPDKESETPNTTAIETSHALRDDSTNPTLAQEEPESDLILPSPTDSGTAPTTDLNQLEQLMAKVVGEN